MRVNRILISGRLAKAFESSLPRMEGKEFRFVTDHHATQQDVDWADSFVAFSPTSQLDLSGLKWVHSLGAGVDGFVMNSTFPRRALLTRTIASFGDKIAEYCLSYILRHAQHHDYFAAKQADKQWNPRAPKALKDINVLIFGTGEIGLKTAQVLSSFGMHVVGISRSGEERPGFSQVHSSRLLGQADGEFGEVARKAEFVIVTLPLTRETTGLLDARVFSQFSDAILMNVGRGAVVVESDMLRALAQGNLSRCVLDVFPNEPLNEKSPLWQHPNVIITPHVAAVTDPDGAVACFLDTLDGVERGALLHNKVDLERGY